MDLSTYRILHAVATTKNMSKAAELLFLTPSAISHAIGKLEKEIGFPLFIRSKNSISLTTYGAELLPQVQNLLTVSNKLDKEMAMLRSMNHGTVHLGTINSTCCIWLPPILRSLQENHPEIQVAVHETIYPECEAGLVKGKFDLAFVRPPVADPLDYHYLYLDKMVCIAPREFHFRQKGIVTIEELQNQTLILSPEGYQYDVKPFFDRHHIVSRSLHTLIDDSSIIALVASGLGISILPQMVVEAIPGDVQIMDIQNTPYRTLGVATQKAQFVTPAAKVVLQTIRDFIHKRYGSGEE